MKYYSVIKKKKKEWSADTCCKRDELWKHYAKWNKSGIEKKRRGKVTQDWVEMGMVSYCLMATGFVWDDKKKKKFWKWWVNRYNTVPNAIKLYM